MCPYLVRACLPMDHMSICTLLCLTSYETLSPAHPFFLFMSLIVLSFLFFCTSFLIMVLQPLRTTCMALFTCGAGAGRRLSGLTRRTGPCVLWFWRSCSGPTLRFPTWLSTPVLVSHLISKAGFIISFSFLNNLTSNLRK